MRHVKKSLPIFIFAFLNLAGCQKQDAYLQGYVDARYTYVSTSVSGRLEMIPAQRGDAVIPGQMLFTLAPEPQDSELLQAKATVMQAVNQLKSAKAALHLAKLTLKRQNDLEKTDATAIQSADEAKSQYAQAFATWQQGVANVHSARAAFTKARWNFSEKRMDAENAGTVFDTYFTTGELVPANQPVLSILSAKNIYIIFYVREPLLSEIKLNQPIQISDSENGHVIPAKITFISASAEYTPPVIYSDQTNAKLVYRIEAKPLSHTDEMHPGEPVRVILNH